MAHECSLKDVGGPDIPRSLHKKEEEKEYGEDEEERWRRYRVSEERFEFHTPN
jgi:hypothetical protein